MRPRSLRSFSAARGLCNHVARRERRRGGCHSHTVPPQNGGRLPSVPLLPLRQTWGSSDPFIGASPTWQSGRKPSQKSPSSKQFSDGLNPRILPHGRSIHTCSGLPPVPAGARGGWPGRRPLTRFWAAGARSQWELRPPRDISPQLCARRWRLCQGKGIRWEREGNGGRRCPRRAWLPAALTLRSQRERRPPG